MLIKTKSEGDIKISDNQKLFFPQGMIGFEDYKNYALIDSNSFPFCWLQSLDKVDIAFVVISPFLFLNNYFLDIYSFFYDSINIDTSYKEADKDILVFSVVTIPKKKEESDITINMKAPIIINKKNKQAAQVIQNDSRWQMRYVISKKKIRSF